MRQAGHTQATKDRALELYFKIEKHFAQGGTALTLRDVSKLLGSNSSASCHAYIQILAEWKLIRHDPKTVRAIVLFNNGYPNVVYGTGVDHTEMLQFPRI